MTLVATASQTVGPYFHIGLDWLNRSDIAGEGERFAISGKVVDGDGLPITDALIEIWQADAEGRYPHPEDPDGGSADPDFRGFARIATDDQGGFAFTTVKPGRVPGPGGTLQAPHLLLVIGMRGLLRPVMTRLYFPDEPANGDDPILALVEPDRRATLIAAPAGPGQLVWTVMMQGAAETVFFDL